MPRRLACCTTRQQAAGRRVFQELAQRMGKGVLNLTFNALKCEVT